MQCVNQHFVPQYYLRNFSDNGKVYVFDKKNNKYLNNGDHLPLKMIGFEKNIYDANPELLQFFCNRRVENNKFLDSIIRDYNEKISAPLIKSFEELGEMVASEPNMELISLIAKEDVIDFTVVQFVRTQRFKAFSESLAVDIYQRLIEAKSTLRSTYDDIVNLVFNLLCITAIENSQIWKSTSNDRILKPEFQFMDKLVADITMQLRNMSGTLWISGINMFYKTSDTPILIATSENQKIDNISFPITKRCFFTFSNYPQFHKQIIKITDENKKLLVATNRKILECAERFTYSFNKD